MNTNQLPIHLSHEGKFTEDFDWERVNRSLGWLGDTSAEQSEC